MSVLECCGCSFVTGVLVSGPGPWLSCGQLRAEARRGSMVTKHLTKAKFGMEIFKFCLCLSIPGMAVLVFRKPENLGKAIQASQYVVYPREAPRSDLQELAETARNRKAQ